MKKIIRVIDKVIGSALYRKESVLKDLKIKKQNIKSQCTKEQIKEIKSFWKGLKINNYWFSFYNEIYNNEFFDVRFLPDDIYFYFIDPYYNSREAAKYLDNKNLYDLLYSDVKRPYTQIRKINGWVLNNDYCSLCDDIDFSIVKGKLISKIPNGPGGGEGNIVMESSR